MNDVSGQPRRARRRRRGVILTALLLGPLLLLIGGVFARGTWADEHPRLPERTDDGAICHLCQPSGRTKHVHCAMLTPFSMEEVWAAITDYEHLGDVCRCIQFGDVQREPDGTCRLEAAAESGLPGTVPFSLQIHHEQNRSQYVSSWDEASGDVTVNRGNWTLTPKGPSLTLVELSVEVEMAHVPVFILRNLNLRRVAETVRGLDHHLRTGAPANKW